ncbi:MAG: hypothetical protein RIB32_02030 [Phycisphaerales bacterium]
MIRTPAHLALCLVACCALPAGAQPDPDTRIELDPAARQTDEPAPTPALEPSFDLLRIEAPEIPDVAGAGAEGVVFHAGRSTTFIDGGLGDEAFVFDEALRRHRAPGYREQDAEFDVYDLSLSRDAWSDGPLTVSLLGGVRTVSVQAVRRAEDSLYPDGQHADGFVPVPVVGTGVRLDLLPGLYVAGAAATHTIPDYATMLDLTAQAGLQLHPNAVFQAGYQSVYSSVTVDQLEQRFDEEGFFARLRISF